MKKFEVCAPKIIDQPRSVNGLVAETHYDEIEAKNLTLDSERLDHLSLIDSQIAGGSWINVEMPESTLRRVKVQNIRLSGLVAHTLFAENVDFVNCKLDMTNLRSSKFKNVRFIDCVLAEADFQGSKFTNVAFNNCDVNKIDLNSCIFNNVDLRSSKFTELGGATTLKGVSMSREQLIMLAPIFANEIGIVVEES